MSAARDHSLWLRGAEERVKRREGGPDCACALCGCIGNMECGHFPLDRQQGCTINSDDDMCPCCYIQHEPMSDADYDSEVGQARLL